MKDNAAIQDGIESRNSKKVVSDICDSLLKMTELFIDEGSDRGLTQGGIRNA
ncbi:unnamed protein product [Arabidopsis lyrata]|nr:unnamed protein product [Arabidopsis lyrata]